MANVAQQSTAAQQFSPEQLRFIINEVKQGLVQKEEQEEEYNASLMKWRADNENVTEHANVDSALFSTISQIKEKEQKTEENKGFFDKILSALFGENEIDETNPFAEVLDTLDMVYDINPGFAKKGNSILNEYEKTLQALQEGFVSYKSNQVTVNQFQELVF